MIDLFKKNTGVIVAKPRNNNMKTVNIYYGAATSPV
jgi:hypothetical protein